VISAAALLAAAAVVPFWTIAPPASGGTNADGASAGEAQAAGYAADRRPVPRVVREWAAAWNAGSPEQMAGLLTQGGIDEDHVFQGKNGVAQWVAITTESIDETHIEVTEAFRSGNRIAVQWTFSVKNSAGGLAGLPPTGKSFSVPAASIFEMKGDKIRRVDYYYNLADLLRQVGLPSGAWVPPPAS